MSETVFDDGQKIADVTKNATENIRIRFTEYKGFKLCDIRMFYQAGNGEYKPTGKGFAIKRDLLPELRQAIEEAERLATNDQRA
jgi:hypothetical protein